MFKRFKKNEETAEQTCILRFESLSGNKNAIQPMVKIVPDWYKQTQRWVEVNGSKWPGVKHCMPFLDSITTGYAIVLDEDIYIENTEDGPVIRYGIGGRDDMISSRPGAVTDPSPVPPGCHDEHFIWFVNLAVLPPKGYSILYTHPLNRWELPFVSVSAIVDDYEMPGANASFFLRNDFEGKIPAGTPILQVIPFKRDKWEARYEKKLWEKAEENTRPLEDVLDGFYRKSFWKKKSYR